MLKKLLLLVLALLAGAAGLLAWAVLRKPAMAPPAGIKVEPTPARLARGKYLFENVADCWGCHSGRDFSRFGGPLVPGELGKGLVFPPELGLPGSVVAPNITPDPETGLGRWTDGEKIRAIREGVSRDGTALFPFMPYPFYSRMSDEDVQSLVAYMNSLAPIKSRQPRTSLNFPVNLMIKSAPKPVGSTPPPDRNDPVKYGEYLVTLGTCLECHSPMEKGKIDESKRFAGGQEFRVGDFLVVSANITPDPETGIGKWSEQRFIEKFRGYRAFAENGPPKATQANFTLMPWLGLSRLEEADLKAMYAYLRTVPAISNQVEMHPPEAVVSQR